jgi:hypothetical protein
VNKEKKKPELDKFDERSPDEWNLTTHALK